MRIKGYAIVTREEGTPMLVGGGTGVMLSVETAQALGQPGARDIVLAFTTREPGWMELVCVTDVAPSCSDVEHLVEQHLDEVEALLTQFKRGRSS